MADYIEGKRALIEALRAHVPIETILMADNLHRDGEVADILRKAKKFDVPVKQVPRKDLDERSARGSHQGVMALVEPYQYASMTDIVHGAEDHAEANGGSALVIVLDHINDAGNLGAIARSADAVGASGIVLPNKRSALVTAATYKSSAGAINHVKVTQVSNIAQALDRLKGAGFWVAGASEKAADVLWEAPLYGKVALVMGNEHEGLARLTEEHCDFLIKLPQVGQVSSLNVAQASTAIMYEWMRQCQVKAGTFRGVDASTFKE
jgi:23S rRNA (guanosine2251-2'-O)-methyltransferase